MKEKKVQFFLLIASLAVIVIVGIIFHSTPLIIINSFLGIFTVYYLGQGKIVGNFFGLAQLVAYIYLSAINRLYGEILSVCLLSLPTYIFSIIMWRKHIQTETIQVRKNIGWKEWLLLILGSGAGSVAMFFIFRLFNTAHLVVSVLIFGFDCIHSYLKIKRVKYNFVFHIICYLTTLVLWTILVFGGDVSYVPIMLNYIIYCIFCVVGLINWSKYEKNEG